MLERAAFAVDSIATSGDTAGTSLTVASIAFLVDWIHHRHL
jgi:hypothetical protein